MEGLRLEHVAHGEQRLELVKQLAVVGRVAAARLALLLEAAHHVLDERAQLLHVAHLFDLELVGGVLAVLADHREQLVSSRQSAVSGQQ